MVKKSKKSDVTVFNGGSVFLVTPVSKEAKEWVAEHISEDATWLGNAVGVEHGYIRDLIAGMTEDGLAVTEA